MRGAKVTNLRLCKARASKSETQRKRPVLRPVNKRVRLAKLEPRARVVAAGTTRTESAQRVAEGRDKSPPPKTPKRRKTGKREKLWPQAPRTTRSAEASRTHAVGAARNTSASDTMMWSLSLIRVLLEQRVKEELLRTNLRSSTMVTSANTTRMEATRGTRVNEEVAEVAEAGAVDAKTMNVRLKAMPTVRATLMAVRVVVIVVAAKTTLMVVIGSISLKAEVAKESIIRTVKTVKNAKVVRDVTTMIVQA